MQLPQGGVQRAVKLLLQHIYARWIRETALATGSGTKHCRVSLNWLDGAGQSSADSGLQSHGLELIAHVVEQVSALTSTQQYKDALC